MPSDGAPSASYNPPMEDRMRRGKSYLGAFLDSIKVTICQRCCLGNCDQLGIPLFRSPLVMNQKSSPGAAFLTVGLIKVGAGPMPCRLFPWHWAQFCP